MALRPIAEYAIETSLTVTNSWDQRNHRFITVAQVKGDPGSATRVAIPYSVADTALPAFGYKQLDSSAYSLNCTSTQTFAEDEVFFDNVIINQ